MSKFSREALKEVIKECVVEVLQESFGALELIKEVQTKSNLGTKHRRTKRNTQRSQINENNYKQNNKVINNESIQRSSHLDNINYNNSQNTRFENRIDNMTQTMTSDPVLADIFKDTARTTLQEQISAENGRGNMPIATNADAATRKVNSSTPTDLFGAAAGKWAELAFAPTKGTK